MQYSRVCKNRMYGLVTSASGELPHYLTCTSHCGGSDAFASIEGIAGAGPALSPAAAQPQPSPIPAVQVSNQQMPCGLEATQFPNGWSGRIRVGVRVKRGEIAVRSPLVASVNVVSTHFRGSSTTSTEAAMEAAEAKILLLGHLLLWKSLLFPWKFHGSRLHLHGSERHFRGSSGDFDGNRSNFHGSHFELTWKLTSCVK